MRYISVRVSSVLFLHNIKKTFRVLRDALGFLYFVVIPLSPSVSRQRVQTKHTKSKIYNR